MERKRERERRAERRARAGEDGGPAAAARKPGALLMVLATVPAAYISIEPTEELSHSRTTAS